MANKLEVISKIPDTRAEVRKKKLVSMGFPVEDVHITDAYTIEADIENLQGFSSLLANPVVQEVKVNQSVAPEKFDYAIEVGFLPGVTDNVGNTAREIAEDFTSKPIEGQGVYTSQIMFLSGKLSRADAMAIGNSLSNPVIQRASVKSYDEFMKDNGMGVIVPRVKLHESPTADIVDLLNAPDDSLVIIGKQGIANSDGTRRGPLALDLSYMKAIQGYFRERGRNPTDLEVESIAQTWSEHCKHTIFADQIDDVKDGLFKTYIRNATNQVRKARGKKDICVSVFTDNAGGIIFDDKHLVVDKAETHNSPSALDPFGGSITGIVGVNRDPMGFGMGAKPIVNRYGFCFANPEDARALYKGANKTQPMLSSRRIMEGVIEGVNVGGNCSGIPTPQGFVYFDESYRGKPLVFVGTVGLIPRKKHGKELHLKTARPGDYVVMVGGRVGKDGIHGATFASVEISEESEAKRTSVQVGDPFTEKLLLEASLEII
ncbi:MAG: AIR synthase related protein, partial [archaeon]|nr:AIR synthase related protein [archaeon]